MHYSPAPAPALPADEEMPDAKPAAKAAAAKPDGKKRKAEESSEEEESEEESEEEESEEEVGDGGAAGQQGGAARWGSWVGQHARCSAAGRAAGRRCGVCAAWAAQGVGNGWHHAPRA